MLSRSLSLALLGVFLLQATPSSLTFLHAETDMVHAANEVTIYTIPTCPYCIKAKELLTKKNIPFKDIDVASNLELRKKLVGMAGGKTSVPQIFVGDTHIGGCDDLYALDKEGKLDTILKKK